MCNCVCMYVSMSSACCNFEFVCVIDFLLRGKLCWYGNGNLGMEIYSLSVYTYMCMIVELMHGLSLRVLSVKLVW